MSPTLTPGKCFSALIANAIPLTINPDMPYNLANAAPVPQWEDAFWKQAYRFHPEIETVAIVSGTDLAGDFYSAASQAVHASYGREFEVTRYQPFSLDYYPILTPIVAKNPDVIDFAGGMKGDIDLMVKQVRELGYTGLLAGPAHGDPQSTIDIAGAEFAEGFMTNDPDYSSDLYPESTRQLYAEYRQRYGDQPFSGVTYWSFASVMLYVQAIEKAGSIDPDEAMKVFDDPTWEFEYFGMPGRSLGGVETFGIRRVLQDEVCYSEVINGVKVMKSCEGTIIP